MGLDDFFSHLKVFLWTVLSVFTKWSCYGWQILILKIGPKTSKLGPIGCSQLKSLNAYKPIKVCLIENKAIELERIESFEMQSKYDEVKIANGFELIKSMIIMWRM